MTRFLPVLLVFMAVQCWAQEYKPALILEMPQKFEGYKKIIEGCLSGEKSTDKSFGCMDAFAYMTKICNFTREDDYKTKYKREQRKYFTRACEVLVRTDNQLTGFVFLDERACVKGYETPRDRLSNISKFKNVIDDNFLSAYEKKSCKDLRTYVNLCVYVDGNLNNVMPKDYEKLPRIDFAQKSDEICLPESPQQDGLYLISEAIRKLAVNAENDIFEHYIKESRSRLPASLGARSMECDKVRNSYLNLQCTRYDNSNDEDPFYYTQEEYRAKRMKRIEDSNNSKEQQQN
jgi:hypothetical protein